MHITVSHNKSEQEVMQTVDKIIDDLLRGFGAVPIKILNEKKVWNDSTLFFSFDIKSGFLSTKVKGTVIVTAKDVTIDADFGLLGKLIPAKQAINTIEGRVRGLLQ
jgi:hypothetical protein